MTRHHLGTVLAATCVFAVAIATSDTAHAQACISAGAKSSLSTCPKGKFKANVSKKPQVSFSSAPEQQKTKKRTTDLKPVNPKDIAKTAQRDERSKRLKPRVRKLLITEIANVERLYKQTKKKDKDRPGLMQRLAEGYVELESSAFRDKVESEIKAQDLKRSNPKRAVFFKKEAEKAQQIIKAARKQAIKYYKRLKGQYPKWCRDPSAKEGDQGCVDEVLYYLAYEYEQAGDLDKARDSYLELTQNWKKSRFVPNAYLAFGELFFNEAQGDPSKWPVAANFYQEVLKYPAPDNKLWGYAAYKVAYVEWNMGEYGKAIQDFKKVIEFGMQYAQLPNATGLANSARRDIIPVYALKGSPEKAYAFFRPLSGDKGVNSDKTFSMMEDLGQNLIDTGHYPEAIVLYQDLIKRNKGDNYCFYQAQITGAIMASKSGNKLPIVQELGRQLAVHQEFQEGKHSSSSKLKCANTTAALMTETAMAWHLEAVGSGGVRGTGDATTMEASEGLYKLVVDNFTSQQFNQFKFPRIIKQDWPTIPKIRYAMADLLYFQKKWDKCGSAFDAVVAEDPNGPNAAEAAFASVLCYQNIYAMKHKDGSHRQGGGNLPSSAKGDKGDKGEAEKFKPKEFTEEQNGMITAFNRYVCYIKPPKGDKEAEEQYVEVKYARGRTYFEAQHWEEAAEAFRDVAINHHEMGAGIYAAQLYLESLNILGSKLDPSRPSCYDNMEEDVPKFIGFYCEGDDRQENAEQCDILFRIQRDIERLKAEELVKKADAGAPNRIKLYEEAAGLFLELWKKYGKDACEQKKDSCKKNEEILYNAAKAFQAARLVAKAIAVRKILIDPKYGLENTVPARKAVHEIGGNYQAIAVYDLAATWYEKFAEGFSKQGLSKEDAQDFEERAASALSDAVRLRLGLGQQDKAMADAQLFNQKYKQRNPTKAAQIAFAIGAHYVDREDWKAAESALKRAMPQIEQKATLDVKIQANALLGRAYRNQDNTRQASSYYGKVRDTWKDPSAMKRKLDAIGGSEGDKIRRLGKVLTAVGEALYHFADLKRVEADAIKFPVYKGSGDRKEVDEHVKTKVLAWMGEKKPAIDAAQAEFLKIVKLEPVPPPRWVIAAGSAVGGMWGNFVAEFRAAPYPKEWDKNEFIPGTDPPLHYQELRSTYLASLDAKSEPLKKNLAKPAYKTCLDYSVKYQYFDQDSRACEEWLSKNYAGEYQLIDEFRGAATRVNTGLDERPLAVKIDGTTVIEDTRAAEDSAAREDEKTDEKDK